MSLKDMTRDELLVLLREKTAERKALREEMLAINVVLSVKTAELKKQEREAAAGNPDAVSTSVIGVAAKATSRAPKLNEGGP